MKRIFLAATVLLTSFASISQTTWKSDKMHSQLKFDITHYGINTVSGAFTDFEVTVATSKEDFSDAVVSLTAATGSITTGVAPRDQHLKSADFFDATANPEISFKSTGIKKLSGNKFELSGDLTMHGITKNVKLQLEVRGSGENPMNKKKVAGLRVTGVIKRSDFNIGAKFPATSLSEEVTITGDGEFGPQ
jgi:polyisoprenoid-binding protein YceI